MRTGPPALLPVFRSQAQAEILAQVLLRPSIEHTLTELARGADVSLPTAHREVQRLAEAGIVSDRQQGRNRLVKGNPDHPANGPLTLLIELSFGPKAIVAEAFANLGAKAVIIFGSWAARYAGQPGPAPNDVDVLVVGKVDRARAYAAADAAQARLGAPVNPVLRSWEQWEAGSDRLVEQIKAGPFLTVLEREQP
jgi:DNA-binding transcriptional ArsR family regulator